MRCSALSQMTHLGDHMNQNKVAPYVDAIPGTIEGWGEDLEGIELTKNDWLLCDTERLFTYIATILSNKDTVESGPNLSLKGLSIVAIKFVQDPGDQFSLEDLDHTGLMDIQAFANFLTTNVDGKEIEQPGSYHLIKDIFEVGKKYREEDEAQRKLHCKRERSQEGWSYKTWIGLALIVVFVALIVIKKNRSSSSKKSLPDYQTNKRH